MVDSNGERYIGLLALTKGTAQDPLGSLGMTGASLATDYGPLTEGLFVRCWGLVTDATFDAIFIDDGSGQTVKVMLSGLSSPITKTFTPNVTFVKGVMGLVSRDSSGTLCIRPRGNADIDL
jgi:hypothetical protein